MGVHVETVRHEPTSLFLREEWATGTTDDGQPFELTRSGKVILLSVGPFGPDRIIESISVYDLAVAWLKSIEEGKAHE